MATVTYKVIQKSIEERIIDAACIYWNVDREYFSRKSEESTIVYRKSVLYYLIKKNTVFSYKSIAEMFGFLSHQPVMRSVENIEAQKDIYKQTFNDLKQIGQLADKLDASFITTSITLVNNNTDLNS